MSWVERAADRSPQVQRTRTRSERQTAAIVAAAHRLLAEKGGHFTMQEVAKEAGVALQTVYSYFAKKDHLLLAVFETIIQLQARRYEDAGRDLPDPVARLRLCVTAALEEQHRGEIEPGRRFFTSEYWRLYEVYPEEMTRAMQPFTDLTERHLRAADAAGLLHPNDPRRDAWLITKLSLAVYHDRAFAPTTSPAADLEGLWAFCLAAVGGS